jgi:hypothetical protein
MYWRGTLVYTHTRCVPICPIRLNPICAGELPAQVGVREVVPIPAGLPMPLPKSHRWLASSGVGCWICWDPWRGHIELWMVDCWAFLLSDLSTSSCTVWKGNKECDGFDIDERREWWEERKGKFKLRREEESGISQGKEGRRRGELEHVWKKKSTSHTQAPLEIGCVKSMLVENQAPKTNLLYCP